MHTNESQKNFLYTSPKLLNGRVIAMNYYLFIYLFLVVHNQTFL